MRGRSLGLAGVFGLTLALLGGCPQPPANNGNDNGAANTNENATANQNENAVANQNENAPLANQNENAPPANNNANTPDNGNQNAPANGNDNSNTNANSNANTNSNSNSNTNTNANDNSGGSGLSANQQAAVNGAVLRLKALDTLIGVIIPLTNTLLEFPDPSAINISGTCPQLAWVSTVTSAAVVLSYDDDLNSANGFGAGCIGDDMDGITVAGEVGVTYTNATSTGVLEYRTMTVAGESITLNATMVMTGGGLDFGTGPLPLSYNGSFAGNVAGDEQFSGNIAFNIRNHVGTVDPALVTINATGYSLGQSGQSAFTVDLANVIVDVLGNSSFTPESGTLTFTPVGEPQIIITFTAQSPAAGVVQVSVGGGAAIAHTVPGAAG